MLIALGAGLAIMGLIADAIGLGTPGFGPSQMLVVATGVVLVILGLVRVRGRGWRAMVRGTFVVAGICSAVLAVELVWMFSGRADDYYGISRLQPDAELELRVPAFAPGHDANGFRNDTVPQKTSIVTIGDSQTWGINATRHDAWPQTLGRLSGRSVYNMSLGSYGPVQYAVLARRAIDLTPDVIVVAVYLGNDLWDAYRLVYANSNPTYAALRRTDMAGAGTPDPIPPRAGELLQHYTDYAEAALRRHWRRWLVKGVAVFNILDRAGLFPGVGTDDTYGAGRAWALAYPGEGAVYDDGRAHTVLMPAYRLLSVDLDEPRIAEGLRLTKIMLERIRETVQARHVHLLVLLIPSKEGLYAEHVSARQGPLTGDYAKLARMERSIRDDLAAYCRQTHLDCLDAFGPLSEVVGRGVQVYPTSVESHPNGQGYAVIAEAVHDALMQRGW